jgi:hypothetical protein
MGDTIKAMTEAVRGRVITQCMDSADVMAAVAPAATAASTWRFVVGATAFPDSARWTTV